MMSDVNDTTFSHVMFLLSGIPGQEEFHLWISIAFGLIYAIAIVGNSVILVIIKTEPSLHEPMYIFLSMLALTDLGFLIATMPTTLGLYFFNFREINLHACSLQVYFVYVLIVTESGVLLSMAFDRFIAISNPLRYSSILTRPRIATMGLMSVIRALTVLIPFPVFLRQFQYCRSNVLTHSYCRNEDILKLACSDVGLRGMYGMIIKILTTLDSDNTGGQNASASLAGIPGAQSLSLGACVEVKRLVLNSHLQIWTDVIENNVIELRIPKNF
nr:olfactory receptor 51A7-like [Pelodiscus sinensis]|eukprot:XP_025045122.1 olfactory receptor 51A7-like [Pelodiscus sinensis]